MDVVQGGRYLMYTHTYATSVICTYLIYKHAYTICTYMHIFDIQTYI